MAGFRKIMRDALGIRVFRVDSPCILCKENMRVAPGQFAMFHGKCRTKGRILLKKINYNESKNNTYKKL